VNRFEGTPRYDLGVVREALGVSPHVPMTECDARRTDSAKQVLLLLLAELVDAARARTVVPLV